MSFLLLAAPARAAVFPSKTLSGILIDDRGSAAERAVLEKAITRLQASKIVRERESLRRRSGINVVLGFDALNGASDGGLQGRVDDASGKPRVLLSATLLTVSSAMPQALAHELYGHAVTGPRAARAGAPDIARLEVDEAHAAVIGAIAARELGLEETPDARVDALLESAAHFHAEVLFSDSPARLTLSLDEARGPRAAVAVRLRELARRRRTLDDRDAGDRVWRAAFAHFETAHRMPAAAFASARASLDAWNKEATVPRRALLDAAQPHLNQLAPFLKSNEGRAYEKTMIELSQNSFAAALGQETAALAARLSALRKTAAAKARARAVEEPEAAAAGALSWEDIQKLYDRDHREFPGHWQNEAPARAPGKWLLP